MIQLLAAKNYYFDDSGFLSAARLRQQGPAGFPILPFNDVSLLVYAEGKKPDKPLINVAGLPMTEDRYDHMLREHLKLPPAARIDLQQVFDEVTQLEHSRTFMEAALQKNPALTRVLKSHDMLTARGALKMEFAYMLLDANPEAHQFFTVRTISSNPFAAPGSPPRGSVVHRSFASYAFHAMCELYVESGSSVPQDITPWAVFSHEKQSERPRNLDRMFD